MQPGDGLVQRACAIRCVSGGIPPVLLAIDQRGELTFTLLAGVDGGRLPGAAIMNIGPAVRARGRLRPSERSVCCGLSLCSASYWARPVGARPVGARRFRVW